ncbi:MAG TPA: aconitase family protein [Burkholderiaceae bacterium]|nr:aconitase family protein [Burkholderiaceae bacterium]
MALHFARMDGMASTLAQKLLARAAGRAHVAVGERLECAIDLLLLDAAVPAPARHAARVLLALDREGAAGGAPATLRRTSAVAWAEREGIDGVIDGLGPAALVAPQRARVQPGMLCVGGDAHCALLGALGVLALARTDHALALALAQGSVALDVPPTTFVRWTGRLCDGVGAHDMALALRSRFGVHAFQGTVLEHCGEAIAALPVEERMSLALLSLALGCEASLMAPDAFAQDWLESVGADLEALGFARWHSDEDAPGVRHHDDASSLVPLAALPGEPAVARPLDELEPLPVDVAWLGGCAGGKFHDLRAAARVLAGYRVAAGVRLLVAPASVADRERAGREGVLRRLSEAGAVVLPPDGDNAAVWREAAGRRMVSAAPGPRDAEAILASPFTVAASALSGRLSDARSVLA